jgi:anti-anti-sigma regulatory factor
MKNIQVEILHETEKGTNRSRVMLSGELTIANAHELKTSLEHAIASYPSLCIQSDNNAIIDLTAIQLLVAAKNHAMSQGKQVSFDLRLTDDLNALMERSGFGKILSNSLNS